MPNHSGTVSTSDNKSILSVTDANIETVVDFFKNWISKVNNINYAYINDEIKLKIYNNTDNLNNKDLVIGITNCYRSILPKYSRSEQEPYIYTEDEDGTYTKVRGNYELIENLGADNLYILNNGVYTSNSNGQYYSFLKNILFVSYKEKQLAFGDSSVSGLYYRFYSPLFVSGWSDWVEMITDNNLEDKVSNCGFVKNVELLNLVYPVGSVYMSFESTSPATLFGGGTWQLLDSGSFLRAGSGDELNVGGANTVTLQRANLPTDIDTTSIRGTYDNPNTHSDTISALEGTYLNISTNDKQTSATVSLAPHKDSEGNQPKQNITFTLNSTGAQQPISIIPPFQEVYMWRRTA